MKRMSCHAVHTNHAGGGLYMVSVLIRLVTSNDFSVTHCVRKVECLSLTKMYPKTWGVCIVRSHFHWIVEEGELILPFT
jgi:hypothetical protein